MGDGVKTDIPYLFAPTARGRHYTYYRRGGKLIPIAGQCVIVGGTVEADAEWWTNYRRIHDEHEQSTPAKPSAGTLRALVIEYKASTEFRELADKTKTDYRRYLDLLTEQYGDRQFATMPKSFVFKLRDKYADRPGVARYILAVLKILMSFAVAMEYRTDNPVIGVRLPRLGAGSQPWDDFELDWFHGTAPPNMVLALTIAVYTGQRESDILGMTWGQYDGTAIEVVQQKTGARVWIPAHSALRAALAATAKSGGTILTAPNKCPWRPDHFRHMWRRSILESGLDGKTFHGLRKTAAAALAEVGCSDREIMAITGHTTSSMVTRYTAGADQKRRAKSAMAKLEERGKNDKV